VLPTLFVPRSAEALPRAVFGQASDVSSMSAARVETCPAQSYAHVGVGLRKPPWAIWSKRDYFPA
jgi:hypothetical protein